MAMVATCSTTGPSMLTDLASELGDLGSSFGDLVGLDLTGVDLTGFPGVDVGVGDAKAANPPVTAACDKTRVHTATSAALVITNTTYFAEVDVVGLTPSSSPIVNIVSCNAEYFGSSVDSLAPPACPAGGYTCTTTGYVPPVASVPCQSYSFARIGAGKVLLPCGSKSDYNYPSMPANNFTTGQRWQTVYVSVN